MTTHSVLSRALRIAARAMLTVLLLGASHAGAEEFPSVPADQESYIQRFIDERFWNPSERFDEFEEFARDLRSKVQSRKAFERALGNFYGVLGMYATSTQGEAILVRWRQKYPTSPVPVLISISGRLSSGMNDFVLAIASNWVWHEPPRAGEVMEDVRKDLLSVKDYASEDPYWYVLMANALIMLRKDRAEIQALVDEGLRKHPKNYELMMTGAAAFLGKWGGDGDAFETYAQRVLALSAPDDGVANYALLYDVAMRAQYGTTLFDLSKVNWQLLMSAERQLVSQAPTDAHISDAAVMACIGGNRRLARDMLQHANFRYYDVYWYDIGTKVHPYKICRDWAGGEISFPQPSPR